MSTQMPSMLPNMLPNTLNPIVPVEDRSVLGLQREKMMNLLRGQQVEPQKDYLRRLQVFQALNRPGRGPVSRIANPVIAGLLAGKIGAQLDAQQDAQQQASAALQNLKLQELVARIGAQRSLTSYRGMQYDDLAAKMADARLLTPQEKLQGQRYAKKLDPTPKEQADAKRDDQRLSTDTEYKKNLLKVRVEEYNAARQRHVESQNAINERFDLTREDKKSARAEEAARWEKKQEDMADEKTYKRGKDVTAEGFRAREVFDREERTAILDENKEGYANQLTSLLSMSAKIKDPTQRMQFLKSNYGPLYKEMTGKDVIFPDDNEKILDQIFNFFKSSLMGPMDRGKDTQPKDAQSSVKSSVPTVKSLLDEALEDE